MILEYKLEIEYPINSRQENYHKHGKKDKYLRFCKKKFVLQEIHNTRQSRLNILSYRQRVVESSLNGSNWASSHEVKPFQRTRQLELQLIFQEQGKLLGQKISNQLDLATPKDHQPAKIEASLLCDPNRIAAFRRKRYF